MLVIILIGIIVLFIVSYRFSSGAGVYKFINEQATSLYDKYAPYSYKEMRRKIKSLGLDYTPRQYLTQVVLIGGFAAGVGYLYFYSLIVAIVYLIIAIAMVPSLTYLSVCYKYYNGICNNTSFYKIIRGSCRIWCIRGSGVVRCSDYDSSFL